MSPASGLAMPKPRRMSHRPPQRHGLAQRSAAPYCALYVVLLAVALWPLFQTQVAPLIDLPNHLARMYILAHHDSSADLQRYYSVRWAPLPNLAMDGLVTLLARVVSVPTATKIFLGLVLLLTSSGVMALHGVVHRRLSLMPLAGFFFLYTSQFLFGLVNYAFGVGLFLWVFAAWIRWREAGWWFRLAVFSVLCVALFFCHLFAVGIYGLAVIGYESSRRMPAWQQSPARSAWRWLVAGAQFIPAGLILVFLSPTAAHAREFAYGSLVGRLFSPFTVVNNYHLPLDLLTFVLLAALFLAGVVRGHLRLARSLYGVLALFALCWLAMPNSLFSATDVMDRSIPVFALLLVAGVDVVLPVGRWTGAVVAGLLLLFVIRMAVVTAYWKEADGVYAAYASAFERLPVGSRLAVQRLKVSQSRRSKIPLNHIACLAILDRQAFVPILFAKPGQHSVAFVPPYDHLAERTKPTAAAPGFAAALEGYDFLLVIDEAEVPYHAPAGASAVFEGKQFCLYRLAGQTLQEPCNLADTWGERNRQESP